MRKRKDAKLEHLWAPWRKKYFEQKDRGCFLCRAVRGKNDRKHFVVERSKHSFSILNLYPYNNGHLMIVPNRHVSDLEKLNAKEREDLLDLLVRTKRLCQKALCPDGFNAGINFGKAAGAGLADHIHIHLVPRWRGDTNFMPVVSETKVISQSLEDLYRCMTEAIG